MCPFKSIALATLATLIGACSTNNLSAESRENDEQYGKCGYKVQPLVRVSPRYPEKLRRRGIEGQVMASFTVGQSGKPENIQIVATTDKRFNTSVIKALQRWVFSQDRTGCDYERIFTFDTPWKI